MLHFVVLFGIMVIAKSKEYKICLTNFEGGKRAMGPYYIPRNVKDEGRILFIFTGKSMIYTAIGAGIGIFFNLILSAFGAKLIGMILIAIFALIGFAIGTFKMPNVGAFTFTKKVGGEPIDDIILRAIKFKKSSNKIYVYDKEETKDE